MILGMLLWLMSPILAEPTEEISTEDIGVGEVPLGPPLTEKEAEPRSRKLSSILRCPVCQGLSVADSRSDAALAMAGRIQGLVQKGYTDEQVVDYFVDRYGEWVLLRPQEDHLFIWLAPVVVGLAGGVFVLSMVRGRRREEALVDSEEKERSGLTMSDEETRATPLTEADPWRQRILEELEGE